MADSAPAKATMELKAQPPDEGQRIDRYVARAVPELSRSRIQQLIAEGRILLDGQPVRASHRLNAGDPIQVEIPPPEPVAIRPEDIPLDVLFEDDHLLVVNKPRGMSVHPAGRLRSGTLVNALLGHCERLSGINGVQRPGIVHRLDKDTTGLLMVAKDDVTHRGLARQLEARTVARQYAAVVWGFPSPRSGRIEGAIGRHPKDRKRMAVVRSGGRHAATRYETVAGYDFLTSVAFRLETGRTHQIRVHAAHTGHPVFGDSDYGGGQKRVKGLAPQFRADANGLLKMAGRQMLHAESLGFEHPVTHEHLSFRAGPPADMAEVLRRLEERMRV
jgi:23S rRNA pseudouridine1911/1915/1917 synthase